MAAIRDRVNAEMPEFGVAIEDVRIRRADLPEENTRRSSSRMQSERQRVAAQARAEGAEASARIRADAERERTVLLAEARATADKLRGEGEARGDPHFRPGLFAGSSISISAWRTLQAYRDIFDSGTSRLVLTPDNDFLRYLQPADAGGAHRPVASRRRAGPYPANPPGNPTMRLTRSPLHPCRNGGPRRGARRAAGRSRATAGLCQAGARQFRRPCGEAAAGGGEHLLHAGRAGAQRRPRRRGPEIPMFPPGSPSSSSSRIS